MSVCLLGMPVYLFYLEPFSFHTFFLDTSTHSVQAYKAFAKAVALRKTIVFALQMSYKDLALLVVFR